MYQRGDRVRVEGYRGRVATLRVWGLTTRGIALCSEDGYQRLNAGCVAPIVGFPMCDVKELIETAGEPGAEALDG